MLSHQYLKKIHNRLKVKFQIRKDWMSCDWTVLIMRRYRISEAQMCNWSLKCASFAQEKLQKKLQGWQIDLQKVFDHVSRG